MEGKAGLCFSHFFLRFRSQFIICFLVQVTSLHELCCHAIVGNTSNVYGIDKLPLPDSIKANLKSYALNNATNTTVRPNYKSLKEAKRKKEKTRPVDAVASKCVSVSRKSCVLS